MTIIYVKVVIRFLLIALGVVGAYYGYRFYEFQFAPGYIGKAPLVIEVGPGQQVHDIMVNLHEKGLKVDPFWRKLWIRQKGVGKKLRVGEFEIQPGWSGAQILHQIFFGTPVTRTLTVTEGSNIYDVEAALKTNGLVFKTLNFHDWVRNPKLLERMGVPAGIPAEARTLEGFLFPETYTYFKSDGADKVLESMLQEFEKRALPKLMAHPMGKTPEGRYQLLTLASIVEKESGDFTEQPVVASVFWNRIKKHMRLESDPTIIYGLLPNYDGMIHTKDIHSPSLWNTYVLKGLPAGPISNPGLKAIEAVCNPAQTDYLFFVSKGDGNHVFSNNYKDHAGNVRRFQLHLKN